MTKKKLIGWKSGKGRLSGYEFKWGEAAPRPPKDWLVAYPNY